MQLLHQTPQWLMIPHRDFPLHFFSASFLLRSFFCIVTRCWASGELGHCNRDVDLWWFARAIVHWHQTLCNHFQFQSLLYFQTESTVFALTADDNNKTSGTMEEQSSIIPSRTFSHDKKLIQFDSLFVNAKDDLAVLVCVLMARELMKFIRESFHHWLLTIHAFIVHDLFSVRTHNGWWHGRSTNVFIFSFRPQPTAATHTHLTH